MFRCSVHRRIGAIGVRHRATQASVAAFWASSVSSSPVPRRAAREAWHAFGAGSCVVPWQGPDDVQRKRLDLIVPGRKIGVADWPGLLFTAARGVGESLQGRSAGPRSSSGSTSHRERALRTAAASGLPVRFDAYHAGASVPLRLASVTPCTLAKCPARALRFAPAGFEEQHLVACARPSTCSGGSWRAAANVSDPIVRTCHAGPSIPLPRRPARSSRARRRIGLSPQAWLRRIDCRRRAGHAIVRGDAAAGRSETRRSRCRSVGLGCARIGGGFQSTSKGFLDLLAFAFDSGVNFFDTADMYSQGESEAAAWARRSASKRDRVVIAAKSVTPCRHSDAVALGA